MSGESGLPSAKEIIAVHEQLQAKYDLDHPGVRTPAPTLALQNGVIEEAKRYDDPYHRAAVLLFRIQSVHVFEDANKRTAWTVVQSYLDRCGIDSRVPQDDETVEQIVRRAGLYSIDELAQWFETGEIDTDRLQ